MSSRLAGLLAAALVLGALAASASLAVAPPPDLTGTWQAHNDTVSPPWQLTASNGGQALTAVWKGGDGHTALRGSFSGTLDQSSGTNVYRGTMHVQETSVIANGTMSFQVVSANQVLMTYQQDNGPHAENVEFDRVPAPVFASKVTADPVSGKVLIELPHTKRFVDISQAKSLPVGSIIDTRHGRVRLTTSDGHGGIQTAAFYQGEFKVLQAKRAGGLADLALFGGSFKSCRGAARAAAKPKSIRKLWGDGAGKFRTVGRFAAATVRGTTWLTNDRCDGTQISVTVGSVTVRDLVKKRNVTVTAPGSYLAAARKR